MVTDRTRVPVFVGLAVGTLFALPSCTQDGAKLDKEQEQAITLDQLPAAVRATILKEAAGNPICEIEKKVKAGKTVYEAEWLVDATEVEITVSEDGKLLGREVEKADGDDGDKGARPPATQPAGTAKGQAR